MRFLDELRTEHDRIDRVLGSLRTYAALRLRDDADPADLARFVAFFEIYAGAFHHEREEEILFPALTTEAALPPGGPISVLLDDHHDLADVLARLREATDAATLNAAATEYSHRLWQHMDVENSVLFPESESQLGRNGVRDLTAREPDERERAAAEDGDALIARYPPAAPDAIRGDGCVMCHAYGDTCRGIEREWWNDWAWEEFDEHVAAS